ncbi:MAG TPA: class I SAM-dependent methyltransferase [Candidatus Thermoplasmatota archaeon]|nr:class I SAM-dependent methyltransferase [Candidatus Thermoplasmatota archaeon]
MKTVFRGHVHGDVWERIWVQQGQLLSLADDWWRLAGGAPGSRVLDVGCGPGRFALRYAELGGLVTAIDLSPDALAFLQAHRRNLPVSTQVQDAEAGGLPGDNDLAFVTNVLHHAPHPDRLLTNVRHAAKRVLVAEFDPAGPGALGPPVGSRLSPARLHELLKAAGYTQIAAAQQLPFEHYAVVAER